MKKAIALSLVLSAFAFLGCPGEKPRPKASITPEKADALRQALVAWFQCEECTDKEMEAVTTMGQDAVPSLAATLKMGPSPSVLESARLHLEDNYRALKEYEKTHPSNKVSQDEESFVKTYLDNVEALYRIRAAKALGAIGGPEAKKALAEAQNTQVRADVKAAVEDALNPGKR